VTHFAPPTVNIVLPQVAVRGHFALRAPGSARSQDTSCGADTTRVWLALILLPFSQELLVQSPGLFSRARRARVLARCS
jgi:hypothetical protein